VSSEVELKLASLIPDAERGPEGPLFHHAFAEIGSVFCATRKRSFLTAGGIKFRRVYPSKTAKR
jgi:hypothetical protein